jgi:hypothetical protein
MGTTSQLHREIFANQPRPYSQAEEKQFAQAKQELLKNRWDFYTVEGDEHNRKLIDLFFQANRQLPVTVENVFKAVAARQSEFKSLTPAQAEYFKIASEDIAKATELEDWLANQGQPAALVNSGEKAFENMSLLLAELRGRWVTPETIRQAEGRINFKPGRKLHYVPLSRRVDARQHTVDESQKPGQFIMDANKTKLDYSREREQALAKKRPTQPDPAAVSSAAQREAEAISGNTHSQTDQLQRVFVTTPGTSDIDWPATLNARRQMQSRFNYRGI